MCHTCKVTQQRKQTAMKMAEKELRHSMDSRCAAMLANESAKLRLSQKRSASRAASLVEPIDKELRIKIQRIDDQSDSVQDRMAAATAERSASSETESHVPEVEPDGSNSSTQMCAEERSGTAEAHAEDSNSSTAPSAHAGNEEEVKQEQASQPSSPDRGNIVPSEVSTGECSNDELPRDDFLAKGDELAEFLQFASEPEVPDEAAFDEESQHPLAEEAPSATVATNSDQTSAVIDDSQTSTEAIVEAAAEPKTAVIESDVVEERQAQPADEELIGNEKEADSIEMEVKEAEMEVKDESTNDDDIKSIDPIEHEQKMEGDDIGETNQAASTHDSTQDADTINAAANDEAEQNDCKLATDDKSNTDDRSTETAELNEGKAASDGDKSTENVDISESISVESVQVNDDRQSDDNISIDDEYDNVKNAFDVLIEAASILNPRQFELPRQMNIFPQFPGDEKSNFRPPVWFCWQLFSYALPAHDQCYSFPVTIETSKTKKNSNRNGTNGNSSRTKYELDGQGLVPLPAATCFHCRKSCKKAPLVACDYCPLLFHQVNARNTRIFRVQMLSDIISLLQIHREL